MKEEEVEEENKENYHLNVKKITIFYVTFYIKLEKNTKKCLDYLKYKRQATIYDATYISYLSYIYIILPFHFL